MDAPATKTGLYTSPYDPSGVEANVEYVSDEILVKFSEDATPEQISAFETEAEITRESESGFGTILYKTSTDPLILSAQFAKNPAIEIIEPNLVRLALSSGGAEVQRPTGESPLANFGLVAVALVVGMFIFGRE
jgi:hypothetical protein